MTYRVTWTYMTDDAESADEALDMARDWLIGQEPEPEVTSSSSPPDALTHWNIGLSDDGRRVEFAFHAVRAEPRVFTAGPQAATGILGSIADAVCAADDARAERWSEEDSDALDRLAGLLDGVEWEASYLDDVAEAIRATGRTIREPEEGIAIDDVVDELDAWGIAPGRARAVVTAFADSGDCNGYPTLAVAVEENTAGVVAEWMVDSGYFEGPEA